MPTPRLLAPMAAMLGERRGRLSLSAPAMRSLLDGIASRLDEARDLSRYLIGLLIFLGLLGTFWGLSQTVGSVGNVIRGLTVGGGDVAQIFETLKAGLRHRCQGWARLSPRRCSAWPARWCWASSTCRRPGAEPFLQRAGGVAVGLDPAVVGRRCPLMASRPCRSTCRRCWSRRRRAWKACSGPSPAARRPAPPAIPS